MNTTVLHGGAYLPVAYRVGSTLGARSRTCMSRACPFVRISACIDTRTSHAARTMPRLSTPTGIDHAIHAHCTHMPALPYDGDRGHTPAYTNVNTYIDIKRKIMIIEEIPLLTLT